jgi:transposase InsO family protein
MGYFNKLKSSLRRLGRIKSLDAQARARLAWFDEIYRLKQKGIKPNIRNLSKYRFGISKSTFYRWKKRYNPFNLRTLANQRRGRKKGRLIPPDVKIKLTAWKLNHPAKGHIYCWYWHKKYDQPLPCCPTTIYNFWKDKGLLYLTAHKSQRKRKPYQKLVPTVPGYIQIDTKELSNNRFQYTIKDLASRRRWLYGTAKLEMGETIKILEDFLSQVPFRVLYIQFDNGKEFQSRVERWLTKRHIQWQHTWVGEKEQNGAVESSHKTDEKEFYLSFTPQKHSLEEYQIALKNWEHHYNFIRLHSALNWQTPEEYLKNYLEKVSH